jgi:hypothetical protein
MSRVVGDRGDHVMPKLTLRITRASKPDSVGSPRAAEVLSGGVAR